ncbi:MAG: amidohydrolase family protein [Rhodobacteraceae bacterium]|jgi:imidazolonepropionase-like amidohydrolase|nr:amidohydrolase family protein [Paracoccaceae bacterium]
MKLFRADRLIDGTGAAPVAGAAVLVAGDRILAVGRAADIGLPEGAEVIDASPGGTLMPGLVDAHVHLAYSGAVDPLAFRAESATLHYPAMALRAAAHARATLAHGFTAVRDMHAPGGTIIDLKRVVDGGLMEGPRMIACGLGLTVTGGHMDQPGFADHMTFRDMNGVCEGPDGFRAGVRAQLKRGADFIKLNPCVGHRGPDGRLSRMEMTRAEIRAACDEAHEQGAMVGAHTSGGLPLRAAVEEGVDTVEHGHWIDDETLDLMAERGTWLVPTLAVHEICSATALADPATGEGQKRWAREADAAKWDRLTRAHRAGVRLAAGSDAGFYLRHGRDNGREIDLFVEGGFTPLQAITIATANGADLLGIEAGRLAPGRLADLLIVDGDPSADIRILRDPRRLRVFKGAMEAAPHPLVPGGSRPGHKQQTTTNREKETRT